MACKQTVRSSFGDDCELLFHVAGLEPMRQRSGEIIIQTFYLKFIDHLVDTDGFVFTGDQHRAELARIDHLDFRTVFGIHGPETPPILIKVNQDAIKVDCGNGMIKIIGVGGYDLAQGIADL